MTQLSQVFAGQISPEMIIHQDIIKFQTWYSPVKEYYGYTG